MNNEQNEMVIQYVPINEVRPYSRNARINTETIEALVASIREFGMRTPIQVDEDMVIICGHARWSACQFMGIERVPVVICYGLDPEKVKAYRILDNKIAEKSKWNPEFLIPEIRESDTIKKFEVFFPELKLPTPSMSDIQVDSVDVQAANIKADAHFTGLNKAKQESYKTIMCPHCGESFEII